MRVALFSECYSPVANGVVTSVMTLRRTLRSWGHTVYVFAPGSPQADDGADVFRLPELPFPRHPYHFARPFPRMPVDFGSLNVELVHCQHPFTVGRVGADMALRHNLPMVYTAHSLYDTMAAYMKSSLARTMTATAARGMMQRFCARADYVIAPSRYTRDALRAGGIRARFAVVPSGIVPPDIRPESREKLRLQLGLSPETPLLLYVGRLGPEKRVDILISALHMLKELLADSPLLDFRLVIVGDGKCRPDLEAQTHTLGLRDHVVFAGGQPHALIDDWYAAGDIFVLPSPSETQGLVLVEAMAAGLPCVAVDRCGPREIVVHGQTGLRVPLDPQAFANALTTLLADPAMRRRLGRNGRLRARYYSPEEMASGVLNVYEAALRVPRPVTYPVHGKASNFVPLRERSRSRRV